MKLFRHWKMVGGLMAIFAAGMGTGAIGTVMLLHRVFTRAEPQDRWVTARLADLEKSLKLTPEQKQRLRPIVDRAGMRFRDIGSDAYAEITRIAGETRDELARELTPEQKAKFEEMRPQVLAKLRELAQREITVRAHRSTQSGTPKAPSPASGPQK